MPTLLHQPLQLGSLTLPHRLIQGPLAGYSCAPFRALFAKFLSPAYCVSEMISAQDLLFKHDRTSRYVYRAPEEGLLAYQLSGTDAAVLVKAAIKLQDLGADLIDLNCGCPKTKIRKKGAGSALLETPERLIALVAALRSVLTIPLTVKIRLQEPQKDVVLAQQIEAAGADALIVHGRRWMDDYDVAANFLQIAAIKQQVSIPVIANGDITDEHSLQKAMQESRCDAFMISRAGTGKPWLYQALLNGQSFFPTLAERIALFMVHLEGLATLENDYKAVLQSKSLIRYYFRQEQAHWPTIYALNSLQAIALFLQNLLINPTSSINL